MGRVKDIYWHHMQAGDEFVGRCVSMLNMLGGEFGVSPPHFENGVDASEIHRLRNLAFPHFTKCEGMESILNKALASMIFRSPSNDKKGRRRVYLTSVDRSNR